MKTFDKSDVLGGALVIAIGGFIAIYAGLHYDLGTLKDMRAGTVPFGLGVILICLGAAILIPGLMKQGELPQFDWKQYFFVVLSLGCFAVLVDRFGLVAGIIGLIFTARLADHAFRLWSTILLSIFLCVFCVVVFVFGLGVSFEIFG